MDGFEVSVWADDLLPRILIGVMDMGKSEGVISCSHSPRDEWHSRRRVVGAFSPSDT